MFRDTAHSPPSSSLVKYFDDTRVESLITVSAGPVVDARAWARQAQASMHDQCVDGRDQLVTCLQEVGQSSS